MDRFLNEFYDSPYGKLNEREEVRRYNGARQNPDKYAKYLKDDLEPRMKWLADRLANAVINERHCDWNEYWAWWREEQLLDRSKGAEIKKTN